jgi:hypothetical protein
VPDGLGNGSQDVMPGRIPSAITRIRSIDGCVRRFTVSSTIRPIPGWPQNKSCTETSAPVADDERLRVAGPALLPLQYPALVSQTRSRPPMRLFTSSGPFSSSPDLGELRHQLLRLPGPGLNICSTKTAGALLCQVGQPLTRVRHLCARVGCQRCCPARVVGTGRSPP